MTRAALALAALAVVIQMALSASTFSPAPHTGGDNAGYLILGFSMVERSAYLDLADPEEPKATKYPPVYPALLAAAMIAGVRTWAGMKALSLILMALAVLAAFLWVEHRRGAQFAFLVAMLLALSDTFLWHSHWILSDPLFLVLTITSLWALDRAEGKETWLWLSAGCLAAILAFFTRSAGLPLVLAVGIWMTLKHRRAALGFGLAFGIPALAWWLRTRGVVGSGYVAEFWLIDPYRPDVGTIGPADLLGRVRANLQAYVGRWIPGGIMGVRGLPVAIAGVGLTALATAGWYGRTRKRLGVAELFAPLYLGLILLWPVVWAGDRFALPLYPLVLFYAGDFVLYALKAKRISVRRAAVAVLFVPLAIPAAFSWTLSVRDSAACRRQVRSEGAFACYQTAVHEYVKAAQWAGTHLSPRDAVFTRKPRLFFVLSGVKARVYPLTPEPTEFLDRALSGGVTHLVMDYLDTLGAYYLVPVIEGRTGAFCSLVGFGDITQSRTEIFGILPPAEWEGIGESSMDEGDLVVSLRICPGAPPGASASMDPPFGSSQIPLLARLGAQPEDASP